jgi:cardiolipin synthase
MLALWDQLYEYLYYASLLFFLPLIISEKKSPTITLFWMILVIFLPYLLGPIAFLMLGTDRIKNKGIKKLFSNRDLRQKLQQIEGDWAPTKTNLPQRGLPQQLEGVVRTCRRYGLFDAVGNNMVTLLIDAEETYKKMEEAILAAQHHINMDYYIFIPDKIGARFRDLLIKKANEGIIVNFIYDAIGSAQFGRNRAFRQKLLEAGITPRDFLPLHTFIRPWNINLRNHRKVMVIDNKVGFAGSLNFGEMFVSTEKHGYRETSLMIQGPAVSQLQWIFAEDWYFVTGEELLQPEYFSSGEAEGDEIVQVVPSGPDEREEAIEKAFFTAISQAQKSIYFTTPYFVPDDAMNLALQLAAVRGADVRLLVPHKSDHLPVQLAGQSYYDDLLKAGVRIFEYMADLHSKMLVVDGQLTIIGSANADVRSLKYDFEVNVQIYGESFSRRAESIFFSDLEQSCELILSAYLKRPVYKRFIENSFRLLGPFF